MTKEQLKKLDLEQYRLHAAQAKHAEIQARFTAFIALVVIALAVINMIVNYS